jgi:hypothetical protein
MNDLTLVKRVTQRPPGAAVTASPRDCDLTPPPAGLNLQSLENRGRNSVVECSLPKADVVGSNPIARS